MFTQPYVTRLILNTLGIAIERQVISEEEITEDVLKNFLDRHGRKFYGVKDDSNERVVLRKGGDVVRESFKGDGVEVIPFRRVQSTWSVEWR